MGSYVKNLVEQARQASYKIVNLTSKEKNSALKAMAKALLDKRDFILKENKKDIDWAVKNGLKKSFIDRLALNENRIKEMSLSLKEVAGLADPLD